MSYPVKIRPARITDSPEIARIQVDSYTNTYASIFPSKYLAHFTYAEQEVDWRDWFASETEDVLLVAENQEGQIAGYALGGSNGDETLSFDSELIALHVPEAFQRLFIGTRLFAAVCARLQERGCRSVFLWVLEENAARGFYEKLGGRQFSRRAWQNNAYFGTHIHELAYGWREIQTILDHCAALEAQ